MKRRNARSFPDNNDNSAIWHTDTVCLVSTSRSWSLGCVSGAKVSLVGLLKAMAVGVEATGRVVLAGLCTPLGWRLYRPHEVVMVVAVPSGWVVYVTPLWRDEWVGLVWRHKQIFNGFCAFMRLVADAERDCSTECQKLKKAPHPGACLSACLQER